MYAEERQRLVAEQVVRDGHVNASRLVDYFSVTNETVRRDLIALERRGLLRRTHGGAIPVERLGFEPNTAVRETVMTAEKRRIAAAAVEELPEEGAILIDAGTTTAMVAELMPTNRRLTVVTNSLPVANTLVNQIALTVLFIGGRLRPTSLCAVDAWTLRALADIRVDIGFIGTNGLTVEHGMTTSDQAEASAKAAMMLTARRVVLLADHTKVGTEYFHRFGHLSDIDVLITDRGLDRDLAEDIKATGPQVILA